MNKERPLEAIHVRGICIRALLLLAALIVIQQGHALLAYLERQDVQFHRLDDHSLVADLSKTPSGLYYLSVGRVMSESSIFYNDVRIGLDRLTLGAPVLVDRQKVQNQLVISWVKDEWWRDQLFDFPILTNYGMGVLIQAWRSFNAIYMGPVFCLLLLILVFANSRMNTDDTRSMFPHLFLAIAGLIYTFYLSGIPDLFWSHRWNTALQLALRAIFSASFVYLLGSYSRRQNVLLILHIPCVAMVFIVDMFNRDYLRLLYRVEIGLYGGFIAWALVDLVRFAKSRHAQVLIPIGIAWTVLHFFAVFTYWHSGATYLTVWSPAMLAVLACTDIYLIYADALHLATNAESSRRMLRVVGQVAHDIRSPLGALRVLASRSSAFSNDELELVKGAFNRLEGIAQDILLSYDSAERRRKVDGIHVLPVVHAVVRETSLVFPQRVPPVIKSSEITTDVIAEFEPKELQRVLSNLLNNAYDALQGDASPQIEIVQDNRFVKVSIVDKGKGMPNAVLMRLHSGELLTTKVSGHGLGISHAAACLKSWGGKLELQSTEGKGTTVAIFLKRARSP